MPKINQSGKPVPARAKKRKSGVPAIWKFEEAVFDLTALRAVFAGKTIPLDIQQKMDRLAEEVKQGVNKRKYKKQREANNISCGRTSVMFFLKNPRLIPVMAREQNRRKQREAAGEDLTYLELDDEALYMHCKDRATFIYTQDETTCKDYSYSAKYRRIRSNYVYTMGRASRSAQMALREVARVQRENGQTQTQEPAPKIVQPTNPLPIPTAPVKAAPQPSVEWTEQDELSAEEASAAYALIEKRKAAIQKRKETMQDKKVWDEQQRIAQLLHNECNDDFDSEETTSSDDSEKIPASVAKEAVHAETQKTETPLDMKPMFEKRVFHDPEEAEKMSLPAKTAEEPIIASETKTDKNPPAEPSTPESLAQGYLPGFEQPKKPVQTDLPGFEMPQPTVIVSHRKMRKSRSKWRARTCCHPENQRG